MKKNKYVKPYCEIVRFNGNVIATSNCGCFDGATDWGSDNLCPTDYGTCECQVNHNPAVANCS